MTNRPIIGIALGSGGARGWCHVGVLRGLEALGIVPDLVAGSSMGALVGLAWAAGKLDALEDWGRALTARHFVTLLDVSLHSGGLVEAREIETLLADLGIPDRIEALDKPFAAVAADMETGREIWLRDGPSYPAVRASAGIPGVMSPKQHEGRWLLDGGLVNPVPVSTVRAMGAEVIIAVNPGGHAHGRFWRPPDPRPSVTTRAAHMLPHALIKAFGLDLSEVNKAGRPNYFEVLSVALDVMEDQIRRARLAGEPPHVLLTAELNDLSSLEMYRAVEAIEHGRQMVTRHADLIREVCGLAP